MSVAPSPAVQTSHNHIHKRNTNTSQSSSNSPDLRVLHDFFQSLLVPGGRGGVISPTTTRANASSTEPAAGGDYTVFTSREGDEVHESS